MILCAHKEQIELLFTLSSFEVDMSYKRIRSSNLNEVLFATYLPAHGKSKYLLITYQLVIKQLLIIYSYYPIPCLYRT